MHNVPVWLDTQMMQDFYSAWPFGSILQGLRAEDCIILTMFLSLCTSVKALNLIEIVIYNFSGAPSNFRLWKTICKLNTFINIYFMLKTKLYVLRQLRFAANKAIIYYSQIVVIFVLRRWLILCLIKQCFLHMRPVLMTLCYFSLKVD